MNVVKKKTFSMPPISVEEAVMCLDYIDHDCEWVAGNLERFTHRMIIEYK